MPHLTSGPHTTPRRRRDEEPSARFERNATTEHGDAGAARLAVSPDEAARLTGLGRTTIYEALASGGLRSSKIGKRRVITIDALKSWIGEHEERGDAR